MDPDPATDWRQCFERLGSKLLLFARQWLPRQADAEDAVQEAFIRIWRQRGKLNDGEQGLLFAAVRSAALDLLRRDARRTLREQNAGRQEACLNDGASLFAQPAEHLSEWSRSSAAALESALRKLPIDQREVLTLKIWGELTFAEIAVALSISPNTAASRYRYALAALRKLLLPANCHE